MRMTGFKAKSLFTITLSAAIAAFTLSACGGSNSTITVTAGGGTIWGVVTSDSTAIPVIQKAESNTPNVTVQSGDVHMGNHVCGFNVSKNGHSYQFDWYTNNSASASLLQTTECGSTFQQQFLSEAP
jgi:hypothetical protein